MKEEKSQYPVKVAITGTLDLHGYNPNDAKPLILEYLYQCQQKGLCHGRIIHGKGIGTMRDIVHSILKNHENICSFGICPATAGGWGATFFTLKLIEEL